MSDKYDFKALPELGWAALVAALVAIGQVLIALDVETVAEWETWALAAIGAAGRAAFAAIIANMGKLRMDDVREEAEKLTNTD